MNRKRISSVVTALTLAFIMALSPTFVFAQEGNVQDPLLLEVPELNLAGNSRNMHGRTDSDVLASFRGDETASGISATSTASFPLISGRRTGTLAHGQGVIYRMPTIQLSEALVNRAYSFILTMPANADFDLFIVCLDRFIILDHDLRFSPGQTEFFMRTFAPGIEQMNLGIFIESFSGSGTYTVYAGPTWIGKNANGNVSWSAAMPHFQRNLNWNHRFPVTSSNNPVFSPTWSLDLRSDASLPDNALIINPVLNNRITTGMGNPVNNMILQNGTVISGMFEALPMSNPTFVRNGVWSSNPVPGSYVPARQLLRFNVSITSSHTGLNWEASAFSFNMMFPVTPANLRFV